MDTENSSSGGDFLEPKVYEFGPYILDARPHKREIRLDGKPLAQKLTDMEYSVLTFLISKKGSKVAPGDFPQFPHKSPLQDQHQVVPYFSKIKKKMGDPSKGGYIRNERSTGYWFAGNIQEIEAQDYAPGPPPTFQRTWRKQLIFGGALLVGAGVMVAFALYIHKRTAAASKPSTSASSVRHLQPISSDKAKIYLANIQGPDNESYRITDTLYSNLKHLSEKYPDLEVLSFGRSIAEQEDLKPVRDELESKHATLLIWGWYGRTKEKVHVRLHIEPFSFPELFNSQQMPVTVPLDRLEKLDLNLDLSNRVDAISLIVEGFFLITAHRDYKQAERAFAEAAKEKNVAAMMQGNLLFAFMALAQFQQQEWKEADKSVKAALNSPGTSEEIKAFLYVEAAAIASAEKHYSSADSICRRQVVPRITSAELEASERYNLAMACSLVYYEAGKRNDGDALSNQGVRYVDSFQHERLEDYVFQGDSYSTLCAFDSALRAYQKADQQDPNDPLVLVRIAKTLSSKEDFAEADRYFKQVEALDSKNVQVILDHVSVLQKSGDLTQALALSKRAQEINPALAPAYAAEADVLAKQLNAKAAIDALGKAINADPTNISWYIRRARLYHDTGQPQLEFADYENLARVDAKGEYRGLVVRRRAAMMLAQGKTKDAAREFDRAIKLEPIAPAFLERGEYHWRLGETDSAFSDFTKAIDLYERKSSREYCFDQSYEVNRADHALALYDRARAFFMKGNLTAALNDLEKSSSVKSSPDVDEFKALVAEAIKNHHSPVQ